jgi:hypothetical protein
MMHGSGKLVSKGGDIIYGVWENNELQTITKTDRGIFKIRIYECLQRENQMVQVWYGEKKRWGDIEFVFYE